MKVKSLICYKIGYNPDKKQKSKLVEVNEDGTKLMYVIPIVSDKKGLNFMILASVRYNILSGFENPIFGRLLARACFADFRGIRRQNFQG